jgi:hypothetical protein
MSTTPPPVPPPPGAPPASWGNAPASKPFYKKPWGIVLIVVAVLIAISAIGAAVGGGDDEVGDDRPRRNRDARAEETAPPENEPFITFTEFEAITTGMSLEQVEAIIGGPGELVSENQFGDLVTSLYSWEGEGFATSANVTFQGGGVVSKAQFGLP